jgi:hypothetical protein
MQHDEIHKSICSYNVNMYSPRLHQLKDSTDRQQHKLVPSLLYAHPLKLQDYLCKSKDNGTSQLSKDKGRRFN